MTRVFFSRRGRFPSRRELCSVRNYKARWFGLHSSYSI